MEIIVPKPNLLEDGTVDIWPTLGPQICDFIESRFVYGPGTLKGEPYVVRDDFRYLLYRLYEHYPEGYRETYGTESRDLSGRRRFQKGIISLPKGSAKCVAPDTEFILESGERVKAKDLNPGQSVMSYKDGEVVYRKVRAVEEQPLATTYRVHTNHGRVIEVSEGHPFLVSGTQWREGMPKYHRYTANDPKAGQHSWSKAEDLRVGDRLVPALNWKRDLDDQADLGWLLGVLAGDSTGDGRLSNGDKEITDKVAEQYDLTSLKTVGTGSSTDWYVRGIRPLMREHGLYGCNAFQKRVPESVMRGSRSMALGYLAGMLDTDGCTTHKPKAGTNKTARSMEWYSVSENNMRDLHTLLASVGINADVRAKRSKYNGEPYVSWTVVVSNKADLKALAAELPCVRQRNVENLKKFSQETEFGQFGDVKLDKVEKIEPIGETVTIGVEIEDTHVHVTNGLVTHNTELMAIVSLLELHPDAPIRFNGYDPDAEGGLAPGRSVMSPFIPMLAPTLEQLKDLAYGAAMEIVKDIDDAALFDPNKERIMINGEGESKIIPVAASAGRLDGQKPTFQGIDEPLALDTEVPTTEGFKTIETLQPGDFVFDRNGSPVRVLGKSDVHEGRPCYEVTFRNGEKVVTDENHRWKAVEWSNRPKGEQVVTTKQMKERGLTTGYGFRWRLPRGSGWEANHLSEWPQIVSIEPVESVPVQCIEVDNDDHLFVFGRSGYLTHNTHRMVEDRHIAAVTTIENNLSKRFADDPWQLSTTTAGDPSEPSMALREFQYGMKIAEGKIKDPTTFFYHRATSDENAKFDTMENRIKALKEASGPEAAKFRDLFSVAKKWDDESADHSYLERVWCNRWVQSSTSAFDAKKFRELGDESLKIAPGSTIVLGFDGAISDDSTALVATEIETGIQNLVGIWEKPEGATRWQVPVGEVNAVMEDMFEFYDVLKLYADPPYWQESISKWAGRWEKRVVEWPTRNETHIYYALRAYSEAINMGEVGHDNNQALIDHIAASGKNLLNRYDDEGKQKYRLAKRQRDKKIDAAMAAVLSWQARLDALSEGAQEEEEQYVPRRIR